MEIKDILILVLVISGLGFSIYKRYRKSRPGEPASKQSDSSGSLLSTKDDYEPYSKK